ncbi:4-hydroxybenzoate 3-monooxygenase [Gordonia sp. ABSL1-1]|uniref:4-hydroxybenzoate 3-monooxygenase n=1 Tax=Gordonia sp. ABSL1-1 TaxID=3053923 RepID=UPI002573566C|nr:4-hydroxybenzoate 3-monooxygenase [Gordonia sp. ABSL1-1]MDL9936515.1 4-hydroxybenzoate 3-monooxygenase [Gordonia sp. ABSL1-1]
MDTVTTRHQVVILGAGPAGLTLARMLSLQNVDAIVVETRTEDYVRERVRAGVIEQSTVDVLTELGVADRLHREALRHDGFYLRLDEQTHHLDFHALTGRNAFVYGQAEIVADLIDARRGDGAPMVFGASDVAVTGVDSATPVVEYTQAGRRHRVQADFIAGCDGSHGITPTLMPADTQVMTRTHPFAWLGILARTAPTTAEGMYCAHPDGLSVHSMRGTQITRQYLQVPADTTLDDWPDERIWSELRRRSRSSDHPELETGEIFDRSLAPLRSVVTTPMQFGSLFLLGDAAHIVPPTGAKGLNLAISDACVLSHALGHYYGHRDRTHLESYGETALPRIWQAQLFSWTLTTTLHRFDDNPYSWELRRARMRRWIDSEAEQRALGEVYLGLPFPTPWRPE